MTKTRLLSMAMALLGLSLRPLPAQETLAADELSLTSATEAASALALSRPDLFGTIDGSLLLHGLPALTLLDGRRFPINQELGRMGRGPFDLFPLAFLSSVATQPHGAAPRSGSDAPGGVVDLQLKRGVYTGGELGVFYGKSGGKFSREDKSAYIIGTVGNDKVQITAGASYQESSGRGGVRLRSLGAGSQATQGPTPVTAVSPG